MKKEITIYELAGLIKDNKAPKRIKFNGDEYYLEDCGNYVRCDGNLYIILDEDHPILTYSNDKVEIIEEPEEPKELEELNLDTDDLKGKEIPRAIDYLLEGRINEIIRYIKDKENK